MEEYYSTRPSVKTTPIASDSDPTITVSEFDKHHETLLLNDVEEHQQTLIFGHNKP